ncbi:6905_t:CDS:2, partial [Racocetra fulgida]
INKVSQEVQQKKKESELATMHPVFHLEQLNNLQLQCIQLIKILVSIPEIDKLLHEWQNKINTNLNIQINNYKYGGDWYQQFCTHLYDSNIDPSVKRLVAYLLLENVIKGCFKNDNQFIKDIDIYDKYIKPQSIIQLDPSEDAKFKYITGWLIFKITKKDK